MKTFVAFLAGAAVGSAATWFCVKKVYERIAQEEIDSVKEVFSARYSDDEPQDSDDAAEDEEQEASSPSDLAKKAQNKPGIMEYAEMLSKAGYTNYSGNDVKQEDEDVPVVIPPEEFGEREDYEQLSLIYFSDQVLVDDDYNVITNIDQLVGRDSLTTFGQYEDDSVFVRNHRLKKDFEILADPRTYGEMLESRPYKAGME